jgi:hypothetical protein
MTRQLSLLDKRLGSCRRRRKVLTTQLEILNDEQISHDGNQPEVYLGMYYVGYLTLVEYIKISFG